MGMFSTNRISSIGDFHVEAAEGYQGEIGVQLAMVESQQNNYAIFEAALRNDFQEASLTRQGSDELFAFQEGSMSGILENIKQFFVKLLAKIKGLFQAFMAKFDSHVMKDNKAFHDKYSKAVYGKNLAKMKAKYSVPNNYVFEFKVGANSTEKNKPSMNVADLVIGNKVEKLIEDFESDEFICNVLNACTPKVNINSAKDYDKDVHDACFKDEEEVEGFASIIHVVGGLLAGKTNKVKDIEKSNDSLTKEIQDMIKSIEKSKDAILKVMPLKDGDHLKSDVSHRTDFSVRKGQDGKYENRDEPGAVTTANSSDQVRATQKALNYIHTQAMAIQTASGKFTTAALRETKFEVAQARRIFAAAVAYNPKSVSESADMMELMQEAAEYDIYSLFDAQ